MAVITGPKVQGGNSGWYWTARSGRSTGLWCSRSSGADPRQPALTARASDLVYAEHFQPVSVLFGLMPDQAYLDNYDGKLMVGSGL